MYFHTVAYAWSPISMANISYDNTMVALHVLLSETWQTNPLQNVIKIAHYTPKNNGISSGL